MAEYPMLDLGSDEGWQIARIKPLARIKCPHHVPNVFYNSAAAGEYVRLRPLPAKLGIRDFVTDQPRSRTEASDCPFYMLHPDDAEKLFGEKLVGLTMCTVDMD